MADEPYRTDVGALLVALEEQQGVGLLVSPPDYNGRVRIVGALDLGRLARALEKAAVS